MHTMSPILPEKPLLCTLFGNSATESMYVLGLYHKIGKQLVAVMAGRLLQRCIKEPEGI
jgi:hypothetical protein